MSSLAIAPYWYSDLAQHEKFGYGFGVDMNEWIWCMRAKMLSAAEGMARDPNFGVEAMKEENKRMMQARERGEAVKSVHPYGSTSESVRQKRIARRGVKDGT